jgi:hypothetical protein
MLLMLSVDNHVMLFNDIRCVNIVDGLVQVMTSNALCQFTTKYSWSLKNAFGNMLNVFNEEILNTYDR